jgi:hypothetical protein
MEFPCASLQNQARAKQLEEQLGAKSALVHSVMADLAEAAAEFDEIAAWCSPGIRSFAHYLSIAAGFDDQVGSELLRVGHALRELPRIAEAFRAGRLSFDKVRQITTIATPATEEMFLDIALGASGSQLVRICRAMRRIAKLEANDHDQKQPAERGLWTRYDEDGMMRLVARLPSEDGAVVMAALESITGSRPIAEQADVNDPWAARRADALVAMAEHIVAGGAGELVSSGATRQVVVHVDAGLLTGEMPDGRCYVEGGASLTAEAARRIGCDAQIIPVIEREGLPIDVGRKHRTPPDRLRRALEVRDRFCRFPGCGVPAHRAQSHHVDHWADGGPTTLHNMILLCGFHHRRYHDGGYVIRKRPDGLQFETHDGEVIGSRLRDPVDHDSTSVFRPETALAGWGGFPMDFDHTIFVLANNQQIAEARAAPTT